MSQRGLFMGESAAETGAEAGRTPTEPSDRETMIARSALWAAYGDALGWIGELTDERALRRRTGGAPLCRPVEWKRRIGGRAGVIVSLPSGSYSDDTQLRLATGRAIRPGDFDVEAFGKVELPVWLGYALGGGKATAAAANLAKARTAWFANEFKGWERSGGNGAAMRIQPHVWAAMAPGDSSTFMLDVVRNAICTHSHPNGLMGAVLHALSLAHAMTHGTPPSPDDLLTALKTARALPDEIALDTELGRYWRPAVERRLGKLGESWARTAEECEAAIETAGRRSNGNGADRYADTIEQLRLREPERRGSGTLTAIAAAALIWCEERPEEALSIAANALGTDTDTIATMAGAILGAVADREPPADVQDAELFRREARRLAAIARGGEPESFRYPDLLKWSAPKTRADTLIRSAEGDLCVLGLGRVKSTRESVAQPKGEFAWQWLELEIGQTVLVKHRRNLVLRDSGADTKSRQSKPLPEAETPLPEAPAAVSMELSEPYRDLQRVLDYVRKHQDDDRILGAAIRKVVNKGTTGEIAAFTASLIDMLRKSASSWTNRT